MPIFQGSRSTCACQRSSTPRLPSTLGHRLENSAPADEPTRRSRSYRRILVTEGSGGSGLSLRSEVLHSVDELYPEDEFRQLVVTIETAPAFLGGLCELKDHGERGLV